MIGLSILATMRVVLSRLVFVSIELCDSIISEDGETKVIETFFPPQRAFVSLIYIATSN